MQQIKISIQPDGKVQIEVEGVQGQSCVGLTEFLEKALGEIDGEREYKNAYYLKEPTSQHLPQYLRNNT